MKIKTIDIKSLEWWDKTYGNTYFAAIITINFGMKTEKQFKLPFQYGYGSQYICEASKLLIEEKLIKPVDPQRFSFWRYCDENKIILRTNTQKNCLQRELKNI
jgi:hypothetical protein